MGTPILRTSHMNQDGGSQTTQKLGELDDPLGALGDSSTVSNVDNVVNQTNVNHAKLFLKFRQGPDLINLGFTIGVTT
jgi:hypothetical protein